MLSAFTARPIVELKARDRSRIESILAYGDRLLVGLNTGILRIYRVNEIPDSAESKKNDPNAQNGDDDDNESSAAKNGGSGSGSGKETSPSDVPTETVKPTDLLREQEKFSRYKIEQLAIIKEANLLISLSNGYVSMHDLQEFQLQEQLVKTKGASTFAVTSNIEKDASTGVPSIVSRLAVAVKRKLLLWAWRDMELDTEAVEIILVSGIKTITWATGTRLIAGLNSSYVLVDVETKEVTDIVGPGSIGGAPGQEGGRLGGVGMASMNYIGMGGMIPKPLATRLSEGQMLLAKDINTHFIDTDGAPLGRRQIPWASAPEAVGYSYPYLLALQEASKGTLEVRNPETLSLLQSIPLQAANLLHIPQPNISLAHAGKGFLVASERVIWRMAALGYDSQIDALVSNGQLDEAISLLNMLEDALLTDKEGRLREIKMQKAQVLFDQRKYRPSLDLFTEVSAPPERVIKLYPKLIAGDLSAIEDEQDEKDSDESPGATGSEALEDEQKDKGKVEAESFANKLLWKTRLDDAASDTSSIRGKHSETVPAGKKLEGKDLKAAVYELQGFLADVRRRLQRFLNPDGTLKNPNGGVQANGDKKDFDQAMQELLGISFDSASEDVDRGEKLRETAKLVDTTLFRAHMFATPSLAGSLFRIANFCDPDVVMDRLEESGRYNDLIDFLFGKKMHRQALERLRKFGQAESVEESAPQLHGPNRTVAYLQNLPPEMIDLILEFAEWPFRIDPDLGMEIFLADTENAETLPRQKVLDFLQKTDDRLAIRYLEHVINELNDLTPDLHQKLLLLYLEKLAKSGKEEAEDAEEREGMKKRFLDLLRDSNQYSSARMLDRLPREDPTFYEARAIVFSKMGQHRQALEIYVFKLEDPEKAEEYCNRVHLESTTAVPSQAAPSLLISATDPEYSRPSIYHTLLSLYLTPPPPNKAQIAPALDILARHGSRLPASSTLDLIPETLPIQELESYFRDRIRSSRTVLNEGRILAGLQKVEAINMQSALLVGDGVSGKAKGGKSRHVTISEERVCGVCHKRLGGSVISVFPDNSVVHLGCASRKK